jgi:pyruvate dehydrogenase E1 component alpha subunit
MATARKKARGGASAPAQAAAMEPETLQRAFRDMLLLRRFEEKASQLYGMGMIGGFCHLYIGQEAVVTGVQYALGPGDSVITGYRCHAHMLIAGVPARDVMAELTGRAAGASKGKGGSMHMFSRDKNFFGGHGIVGAQVPIGTGIAFAQKYRGDGGVTAAYMGDGALNQGQVHEALNLAALWSLPIVFVIENNRYGMGTSVERASALPELHRVAEPFGMPSAQTDGMDVVAVRDAGRTAMEHCRAGEGPYVLEALTYRYRGHSMSDPAKYRSKEEVAEMRAEHDPIQNLRTQLTAIGAADEDSLKEIDRDIRTVVADAAEFAQNSPEPDPGELLTDVLIEA